MHDLPPRFNADILRGCDETNGRWPDMCEHVSNAGLGTPLHEPEDDERDGEGALTGAGGWYATHQFALDAIFHGRMRRYGCLTNDSSAAAAVFVPFYTGFDFARHHWVYDNATRDAASRDLARWLVARPEWRRGAAATTSSWPGARCGTSGATPAPARARAPTSSSSPPPGT
jgi:hypothetical protein